jgi:hypothetical protein
MSEADHGPGALGRLLSLLALAAAPVLLIVALLSVASAQEPTQTTAPDATGVATPAVTGEPTPDLSITTVVRLEIDQQTEPFPSGTEFEVRVLVDDVEHLAGFSFTISYDPKRVQAVKPGDAEATPDSVEVPSPRGDPAKSRALGDIFAASPRADSVNCPTPLIEDDAVSAFCVTLAAPICLGGPIGAGGSGLLGAVYFRSKGGGPTTLTLAKSELVLDDAQPPCDPEELPLQLIPNRRQSLTLDLAETGGSSTMVIIVIVVVALAVAAGGAGGYIWYRRRQTHSAV